MYMCIYIYICRRYPMDISCLDNHLPTGMHPQLTTSTLFFTQHQLHLLATATLPYLQCQNPAEDTATAFTVQRETDLKIPSKNYYMD